jgi:hypothetical protein
MMVAELSPPMSVENIQLKLKQKINSKGEISEDVLYFQMVGWYCPVAMQTLSTLSTKMEWKYSK